MPLTRRPAVALVLALCALVAAAVLASPSTAEPARQAQPAAGQTPCPNRAVPPLPVDSSEVPAPGSPAPTPVPVPDRPVGGDRMGECGLVLPAGVSDPAAGTTSDSWLLADLDSGAVLAAKNPHGRNRPASVMKVLLAMVVLREVKLDMVVAGAPEDASQEGNKVGISASGQYTVRQLLQGLLLASGNDAANALARQLGGTQETLRKMNTLAADLGALDTRAATPSGLDGPGMSTSSYDVATLYRAAMSNPDFAAIMATKEVEFRGTGDKPPVTVQNQDKELTTVQGSLGGKSGSTDDARGTYVGGVERNGRRLLVVILRGDPKSTTMTRQATKLYDWGFSLDPAGITPVGQLSYRPAESPSPAAVGQADAADTPPSPRAEPVDTNMSAAFGNWGGPLTAVAGVFLAFALVMWWRKRRAKVAARRSRDGFSDASL